MQAQQSGQSQAPQGEIAAPRSVRPYAFPSLATASCPTTTDPSLFSFHRVKQVNQALAASAPRSALTIATLLAEAKKDRHTYPSDQLPSRSQTPQSPPSPSRLPGRASETVPQASTSTLPIPKPLRSRPTSRGASLEQPHVPRLRRHSDTHTSVCRRSSDIAAPSFNKQPRASKSLDEATLRQQIESSVGPHRRPGSLKSPRGHSGARNMATYLNSTSDFFGHTSRFSPFSPTSTLPATKHEGAFSTSSGRKQTIIPQTRELYLHPSQIFQDYDLNKYFDPTYTIGTGFGKSDLESTITLPPMLTLEEIVQPHMLTELDLSLPTTASEGVTSLFSTTLDTQAKLAGEATDKTSSTIPSYSVSKAPDASKSWASSGSFIESQDMPETFSSYLPPTPVHGAFGFDKPSFSLTPYQSHSQIPKGPLGYSTGRLGLSAHPAMSPTPSALSASSHFRDVSPSRPVTQDGRLSQRSDTSGDQIPQKRSGKLPAAVTATLKAWLMAHTQHPYPSEEEKRLLCADTGLTMNQVSNWFINARRRILPNLGNVAMTGNRKQLTTHYNPPGPRRAPAPRQDGMSRALPNHYADPQGLFMGHDSLTAPRPRAHPYGYGSYHPHHPIPMSDAMPYTYGPGPSLY